MPRRVPGDLDDDWAPRQIYNRFSWDKVTERMHRVYRARYYGSLSWLDSNVGALLRTIDELKLAERTLVVYTTDHGDMAAEKGMWLKSVMFDAAARVPLLVRMPGVVAEGRQSAEILNHVDLFPTLAGLVGAEAGLPANLTGRNLSGAVTGRGKGRDISFSVHGVRAWNEPPQQVMARTRQWKFVWYPHAASEAQQFVLYDMQNDPEEITNLASRAQHAAVVREHRKAAEGFLAALKKPAYEPDSLDKERKDRSRNPGDAPTPPGGRRKKKAA
jgi:choline-sulfatase